MNAYTPEGTQQIDDHKRTLAQLEQALDVLDEKLVHLDLAAPIVLRAIGGFALMKYGIRAAERAFTIDIDTVTPDFAPEVTDAVHEVAAELGLERAWVNNDSVLDGQDADLIAARYQALWIPVGTSYRCIELHLASIPTLTRAKIIAVDTAEFSGREQDVPDLLELLRFQGITTPAQFETAYPDPFGEYPAAYEAVREQLSMRTR